MQLPWVHGWGRRRLVGVSWADGLTASQGRASGCR